MKKVLLLFYIYFACLNTVLAQDVITGKIDHNDLNYKNKIIDSKTKESLSDAKITIPEYNYTTYSDKDGTFQLNADISNKTVLFVEKEGYKVFSLTVDNNVFNSPLKIGIEQSSPFDLQMSYGIVHLGDNMFSNNSANSKEFRMSANGPYFSQKFKKPAATKDQNVVIRIGTIIGLDTKKAKESGQNKIAKVYSSPAEVIVNGHRIASLELNGDNFEILIPKNILRENNELIIQTGRNLFQHDYVDYDDMELANVRIEVQGKQIYARN